MGTRLPSSTEVLIIRPTGWKRFRRIIESDDAFPGVPARKPGIPEQDPNALRSAECSCC